MRGKPDDTCETLESQEAQQSLLDAPDAKAKPFGSTKSTYLWWLWLFAKCGFVISYLLLIWYTSVQARRDSCLLGNESKEKPLANVG